VPRIAEQRRRRLRSRQEGSTLPITELLHKFPALDRRLEAVVFDWDGTAVPDRAADATDVRHATEELCALGMEVVVVTGTHVGNVDGQLRARPHGPGRLHLCLNRGSEAFQVDERGAELVARREASADEDAALSAAAEATVAKLAKRGLRAEIVSQRVGFRNSASPAESARLQGESVSPHAAP
jgi:hypothetical protein